MRLRVVVAGALFVSVPALVVCVLAVSATAQVAVAPPTIEVSLAAGQQGEVDLTVANEGMVSVSLFAVPLPEEGMPEDLPGTFLFSTEPNVIGDPYDLAMTSEGRLFVARYGGGDGYTWEFTPELDSLRLFENPRADNTSRTIGIAWMPPDYSPLSDPKGTLWWLDIAGIHTPECPLGLEWAVLIEGDLNGNATGRIIELPLSPGAGVFCTGVYGGLAYDAATALFYYLDIVNEDIYAIDVEGNVADGYPVPASDYDPGEPLTLEGTTLDMSGDSDGAAYVEVVLGLPGENDFTRVVVTDKWGRSTGVETPLTLLYSPDGQGEVIRVMGVLRSRLDPSVMYLTALTGTSGPPTGRWIVAIRAHPLPPRWLRVSPVAPRSLNLTPGETDTLTVRLNADGMEPGVYAGQVALRDGGPNGEEVVTVPVTLTVTPGVDAEDGTATAPSRLEVYPNPSRGAATVALTLGTATEVRVAVYDVLGRRVALLHAGPLAAGEYALAFEAAGLPAGVYLVRAEGGAFRAARRLTVLR